MSSVIILGDPHLGKSISLGKTTLGSNLNSRVADQLNLLDWVLERAIECNAGHIIITGDVFEEVRPHPSLLTFFIAWLKKCQIYGVHVDIIIGNHDIFRTGTVYTSSLDVISEVELENVSIYKEINTILIGNAAFTLVPFRDRKSFATSSNIEAVSLLRDSLVYELASIPITYHKMLVGHLAIEGSIPVGDEIDDIANELFCPLDMFVGYSHVWMGHVHAPQVMQKQPYIAHIGSMDISNFGETDQKKHIVIMDCQTGKWDIEYLPTRALKKLIISVPKDTIDSTDYVIKELEKNNSWDKAILKVEVSLDNADLKSINKATIEKFLTSNGAFNVASISEQKKTSLIKRDANNTIDSKMDVKVAIKTYTDKYIEDKRQSEFIELAMDIYTTYKAEAKE